MLRKLMLVFALVVSGTAAWAQDGPLRMPLSDVPEAAVQPSQIRYWVQFRQPNWWEQQLSNREEMETFVAGQQRNGWEVQIHSYPDGTYMVRHRLMNWGGSRILNTLPEAQRWAANLENQGYEPRIVNRTW
jgi:hypothetical protein